MAINRVPFNALVDDDGSGLVGSIWNKAAIKSVILDPADVAYAPKSTTLGVPNTGSISVALTAPGADTLIVCYGNGPLTIPTLTGGVEGQMVTIQAATSYPVSLPYGTGPSQFLNYISSAPTLIVEGGTATYVLNGGVWRMVSHTQGAWLNVPFNVANFWPGLTAGVVYVNKYLVVGRLFHWMVQVSGGVAPSPAAAACPMITPVPMPSAGGTFSPCAYAGDTAGLTNAQIYAQATSQVAVAKTSGAVWSGTVSFYFTAALAVL